ncbi:MAG: hypothetical protein EAZ27_06730 [Cytophagales bacterium]|nr:MAG: hypothetical protein EAZ27_06730 [Cytophagales bacterium]
MEKIYGQKSIFNFKLKYFMNIKNIILFALLFYTSIGFAQPKGKAEEIFKLINEAKANPKNFLSKNREKMNEYNPKFIPLLEKLTFIAQIIWDNNLVLNCKQQFFDNLLLRKLYKQQKGIDLQ